MILKWNGGKRHLIKEYLRPMLTTSGRLVEPFVGGGSVFFGVHASSYLLGDTCQDLIDLYNNLTTADIPELRDLFDCNEEDYYYCVRQVFNKTTCPKRRAILLTYLNRHGYNGLYRLNQSGGYNVPYGRYSRTYLPEYEISALDYLRQKCEFYCQPFEMTMEMAESGDTIYCDPPYLGVAHVYGSGFGLKDHRRLIELAKEKVAMGCKVVISNSAAAAYLYKGMHVIEISKGRGQDKSVVDEIIVEVKQ